MFDAKSVAYRAAFLNPDGSLSRHGQIVLRDLAKFCRASDTTAVFSQASGMIDPNATLMAEGRRETFTRICNFLKLDPVATHVLVTRAE